MYFHVMTTLMLDQQYSLTKEENNGQLRLIVMKNGAEHVCRKEKLNVLHDLLTNGGHLFKGRLQLIRSNNDIEVIVKNEKIGNVSVAAFEQFLA